jgi:L-ribulokinase
MSTSYALGLDYGTNSVRCLVVDLADGRELADHVFPFPSGTLGILTDPKDPNVARQHPQDYLDGLVVTVTEAMAKARAVDAAFDPARVIGIGVDTTGSTPLPVDRAGTPLGLLPAFKDNLDAMAWLWKDHTGHAEAAEITALAKEMRPQYLAKCGGTYSSEWFWSKILHCKRVAPEVFAAAHSFVEHCDYIPALLAGDTDPARLARGVCSAGHKAMYCEDWGGLPDKEFLGRLDPALAELRDRLYEKAVPADRRVGGLCAAWAEKLGLTPGIAVAAGAFDAHMGAVGAGIAEGTLVKILGTSTCDHDGLAQRYPAGRHPRRVRHRGWLHPAGPLRHRGGAVRRGRYLPVVRAPARSGRYGATADDKFRALAEAAKKPGARTAGAGLEQRQPHDSGGCAAERLVLGQTLHTQAHEIYRALIEATAFGALTIIKRIEEYGVPVKEIVNCGGLAVKNPLLMQIYADVTGRPMKVSRSDQTCALGAAIFGAVAAGAAAGGFASVADAQARMCGVRDIVYHPIPENQAVYARLYTLYRTLHDAFGTAEWSGRLDHVMREVIEIREAQRKGNADA